VVTAAGKAAEPGLFESCFTGFADGFPAALVVVGGDVADAGVRSDGVVVAPHDGQLGS